MRLRYAGLVALTVALGLASRRWPLFGPAPGDVLYATMAYFGLRFLAPDRPMALAAAGAAVFTAGIEVSQLWQAPWLVAWRSTRLGALVLGHGFLWSDMMGYALGVALGWGLDRLGLPGRRHAGEEPVA